MRRLCYNRNQWRSLCYSWFKCWMCCLVFCETCINITRLALAGRSVDAENQSACFVPLWQMLQKYGSLRVVATIPEIQGLTNNPSLPLPLESLDQNPRQELEGILADLQLEIPLL